MCDIKHKCLHVMRFTRVSLELIYICSLLELWAVINTLMINSESNQKRPKYLSII